MVSIYSISEAIYLKTCCYKYDAPSNICIKYLSDAVSVKVQDIKWRTKEQNGVYYVDGIINDKVKFKFILEKWYFGYAIRIRHFQRLE
jgi:hypothetical protein